MPELPEVETMRRDLAEVAGHAVVTTVEVLDERLIQGPVDEFISNLTDHSIVDYGRRGKVLILRLDNDMVLLAHPRMTGRLFALRPRQELSHFPRAIITLSNGTRIVFDDIRRFGQLELVPVAEQDAAALLRNIGHDALQSDLDHMRRCFAQRSIPIKVALLDQKIVAGIGNIYASEILFHCRLDPRTPCNRLKPAETAAIAAETKRVLAEGIEYRGTTIADYRTLDGKHGNYQDHLRVYGREGAPCLRPGCRGTIRKIVLAGRSTYFCSDCQKTGRQRR